MLHKVIYRSDEGDLRTPTKSVVYRALVRPHLDAIQVNCPYLKKAIYHLERIQRAATRWVKGLKDLSYEDRLKELKLQSLEKRRIRNDSVLAHKIIRIIFIRI